MKGKLTQELKDGLKEVKLRNDLRFSWESFWELSTTRHELFPIPWTAINEYAKRWGINTPEEFDSFNFYMRSMDNKFIDVKSKQLEKQRKNK